MDKYEFFSKFNNAVIILNVDGEILYKNNVFIRTFSDVKNIQKFSHLLNFDVCTLDGDSVEAFSPIYQAIKSPQNFFSQVSYHAPQKETLYFNVTAIKRKKYVVIIFDDITTQFKIETLTNEYNLLSEKYQKLYNENKNFIKIKQNAQSQAIKMALINKISNNIRETINISKITNSALKEISEMFGAFKSYYASPNDIKNKTFKIENINKEFKSETGTIVEFDDATHKNIVNKKITVSGCLKEHIYAKNLSKCAFRTIVPIYNLNQLLGIIVILSSKKNESNDELDILESVSSQLGNAIIQASLFNQVNQQKNELQNALKELKDTQVQLINAEKMASLGQLIAGVAHEINTPLASINSNNSIMAKFINKMDNNDITETLKEINELDREAVNRINNIVKSLKKFVRLDEADLQDADINKELDLTLDLIRHETKNKVTINKNYSEIPLIKCYPNMLNQVFMNILVNACQSIETKGEITIATEFVENNLIVKIKDTGKGIPKDQLNKIFTAGFTTKGVGVGTGLGLAISEKIIQKHEGKISVTSTENKGTEFTITIPGK